MPEWFVQIGLGGLLAVLGWLITRKLDGIDSKLDRMEIRQAKIEKDCVTWSDLENVKLDVKDHDRRLTVIETTCKQERGK